MIAAKELNTNEKYHVGSESFNFDERTQVINHIDTFGIFNRWGDIHSRGKKAHGVFYKGTRHINRLELLLNNKKPVLLSSAIKSDNEILSVDLTNPDIAKCNIKENSIHIRRHQLVKNGVFYEEIKIDNFTDCTCDLQIKLCFDADFCDIFEIRGMQRKVEAPKAKLSSSSDKIVFNYEGLDQIKRTTEILFKKEDGVSIHRSDAEFDVSLQSQQTRKIDYIIYFKSGEDGINSELPSFETIRQHVAQGVGRTNSMFAGIDTSNENFNNWLSRSASDLQSLLAKTKYGFYPYAGVPWYNTAFGRDGIITAMEVLWMAPHIARDALKFLAATQAVQKNAARDAEPGKIVHEMRFGEMANTGEVPFKRYYGTIDATPLFIMLAGMYYNQTGDVETIRSIWPNIKAAVDWMDNYGDIDGDGFVEYQHQSENGLTNQGWKDSYDAIMYANGELCKAPIALCEVQGYVYAAKNYAASLAHLVGENDFAKKLSGSATQLKQKFNQQFWDEELGSYVLALDGEKNPCKVLASNAGHCLFTGIAENYFAQQVAKQFMSEEMFSGWGVRTLASKEVRYNPMSYHNGSVWPHDNALIAFGLARYGHTTEAMKIFEGLFDASFFIDMQRMPELFCGFNRRPKEGPTSYPVACSPQAWAVGTVFMLLQACLQLKINGVTRQLLFNKPKLPAFLQQVRISNLKLGEHTCSFVAYRHSNDVSLHITDKPDDWDILITQ